MARSWRCSAVRSALSARSPARGPPLCPIGHPFAGGVAPGRHRWPAWRHAGGGAAAGQPTAGRPGPPPRSPQCPSSPSVPNRAHCSSRHRPARSRALLDFRLYLVHDGVQLALVGRMGGEVGGHDQLLRSSNGNLGVIALLEAIGARLHNRALGVGEIGLGLGVGFPVAAMPGRRPRSSLHKPPGPRLVVLVEQVSVVVRAGADLASRSMGTVGSPVQVSAGNHAGDFAGGACALRHPAAPSPSRRAASCSVGRPWRAQAWDTGTTPLTRSARTGMAPRRRSSGACLRASPAVTVGSLTPAHVDRTR